MRFGLFYQLQMRQPWYPGMESERFWQCVEQAQLAEQCGFETVWIAEHHFMPQISHSSTPEIVLTAIAQHTSVLRVGFGVVLLPIHHPVRVAERVATLDIMSKGRVDFGTGRSTTRTQLDAFGVDPAETRDRWAECVELIPRIWMNDPVSFKGRFYQIEGLSVSPKPVQKPHPPMWVACGQASTYELAARKGIGAIGYTSGNYDEIARRVRLYRETIKQAKPPGGTINNQIGAWTIAHCAENNREAREMAGPEGLWYFNLVRHQLDVEWQNPNEVPESYRQYATSTGGRATFGNQTPDSAIDRGLFVMGDPDSCIRQIERYEQCGIELLLCVMQAGKVPHEKVKRSIQLFGKHVIPHFRAKTPSAAPR